MNERKGGAKNDPASGEGAASEPVAAWLALLRCPACGAALEASPHGCSLLCAACPVRYPVAAGTLRMTATATVAGERAERERTAASFAYEWQRFGATRDEWERNFLDYMRPHGPGFFRGLRMLDAGTGSGRHSRQAALYGAEVAAVDLGESIDVARQNVPAGVLTVQADLERLPFEPGTFDLVISIGVLHHLPDTERALRYLARFARPGGLVRIYLYWQPERRWQRAVLAGVSAARQLTTRLPHRLLELLCYPLAALLWALVVRPYAALRNRPRGRRLAAALPLQTYADYPFAVLVNDQFDRLSAPIERRYTAAEVERMMLAAGLEEVSVEPNAGWIAEGRAPATANPPPESV